VTEVSSLFNGVQIGVETTAGTTVSASKLLNYLSYAPGISLEFNRFRPMGQRVASAITPGKDYTTLDMTGAGSYSELIYPLSSLFGTVTATTVETTGKRRTWTPAGRSEITPVTFTVEFGSATRAQRAVYGFQRGIELTYNRTDGVTIAGDGIAQALADGITLTSSPTQIEDVPILPTHLDVYVDTTSASFGSTKLTRDFNAVFRYNDARDPVWPINSTLGSYGSDVEIEPTCQVELTVEADSTGMGYLTTARAGTAVYIRLSAVSTQLAGASAAKYDLLIDVAAKVSAINAFDDSDGIKVLTYTFDAFYDTNWNSGQFLKIQNTNKTASL
jgi:hypothetical protein